MIESNFVSLDLFWFSIQVAGNMLGEMYSFERNKRREKNKPLNSLGTEK